MAGNSEIELVTIEDFFSYLHTDRWRHMANFVVRPFGVACHHLILSSDCSEPLITAIHSYGLFRQLMYITMLLRAEFNMRNHSSASGKFMCCKCDLANSESYFISLLLKICVSSLCRARRNACSTSQLSLELKNEALSALS